MRDIGFARIFIPKDIRLGETIKVKTAVTHPMEPIERDVKGRIVEKNYNYVHLATVFLNDQEVLRLSPGQSISANPVFSFFLKVTEPSTLLVRFEDTHGGKYEASRKIEPVG